MAIIRLDNINLELLKWAYIRAGYKDEEAIEAFPLLEKWLSKEQQPTLNQLKKFANKFFVPFGYLFLQNHPNERMPFPMFRGAANTSDHFDLNLYDTIMTIRSRQEWLEDYIINNDIEQCKLVGSVKLSTPINETVTLLQKTLELDQRWALNVRDVGSAINILTQNLEQANVFVAYNGVVGNNTHRKLKVSECRGFALVNKSAPYIFVNNDDSKCAQMFTLIHEVTHIMLGISAGHAGEEIVSISNNQTETYCDKVAAEFLAPETVLCDIWKNDIKDAAKKLKVSEIVVARRAHEVHLLSDSAYKAFWFEYSNRKININKKKSSGGDFYLTSVKRVGKLFAIHVRNAVNNRQLNYTDAYRLTGLYGNTYNHFMTQSI